MSLHTWDKGRAVPGSRLFPFCMCLSPGASGCPALSDKAGPTARSAASRAPIAENPKLTHLRFIPLPWNREEHPLCLLAASRTGAVSVSVDPCFPSAWAHPRGHGTRGSYGTWEFNHGLWAMGSFEPWAQFSQTTAARCDTAGTDDATHISATSGSALPVGPASDGIMGSSCTPSHVSVSLRPRPHTLCPGTSEVKSCKQGRHTPGAIRMALVEKCVASVLKEAKPDVHVKGSHPVPSKHLDGLHRSERMEVNELHRRT